MTPTDPPRPPVIEPILDTVTPPSDLPPALAEDLARYAHALVYQDFDTVGDVLDKASRDRVLEQAILQWHRVEEAHAASAAMMTPSPASATPANAG
jgi:hypothetical protein